MEYVLEDGQDAITGSAIEPATLFELSSTDVFID